MKCGLIADIHSNQPALEAVLADCDVDCLVCLGDIVGLLGNPDSVITLVREHAVHTVKGNHDARNEPYVGFIPVTDDERAEYDLFEEHVSHENRLWLAGRPPKKQFELDGMDVQITHSRPDIDDPTGLKDRNTGVHPREFVGIANDLLEGDGIIAVGHTHYQHGVCVDKFDGTDGLVVNPGAVGFPYTTRTGEDDEQYGVACYAVVNTGKRTYDLRTVEYRSDDVIEFLKHVDV